MRGYLSEISEIHVPYCLFASYRFAALPRGKPLAACRPGATARPGKPLAEFAAAVTRHA